MSQVLHIFRKDTRRFWIEILLSVVVAAAFVWAVSREWQVTHDFNGFQSMTQLARLLGLLLGASWCLLLARVVHDELLVGDRQFWITRPYEWPKLLGAKTLFFAVWIGVPYLLTGSWLIATAGFAPLPYFSGMLMHLGFLATMIVLPVFALSSVTSNFGRFVLVLLSGFLVLLGWTFFLHYLHRLYLPSNPYENAAVVPLVFAGCAAALAIGYARRRTWLARGVLIALCVLAAISALVYGRQSLVDKAYPRMASGTPALVNFSSAATPGSPVQARDWDGQVYIDLPGQYSGVADNTVVVFDDIRFTLTAADGSTWTSPWQKMEQHVLPGIRGTQLHLPAIDPAIYNKFKNAPVRLQITAATTRYQVAGAVDRLFPAGKSEIAVPDLGICTQSSDRSNWLHCRHPVRQPGLTYATVAWSPLPCETQSGQYSGKADAWIESGGPLFASVWDGLVLLSPRGNERHGEVCPGSPMTITQYHLLDRRQTDFTLENFVLPSKVQST